MPGLAAEQNLPAWMPTRSELILRPLEKAFAIDPKDPVEIDDAINLENISATEQRVAVFIADIGLIQDETEALELARKRGWSRYRTDGEHVTMFEESIWRPLGLDQRIHNLGAPAVKIAFSFNPVSGNHGDVEFAKVRVKTEAMTYKSADRRIKRGNPDLVGIFDTGRNFAESVGFEGSTKNSSKSKELIANFMIMTNYVVASEMEKEGVPWLYRNHGKKALAAARRLSDEDRAIFSELMKAIYQVDPAEHAGLGLAAYCHITSGLRRYPDTANGLNLDSMIENREPHYSYSDLRDISDEIIAIYRKIIARSGVIALKDAA